MNYKLNIEADPLKKVSTFAAAKKLWPLFDGERHSLLIAFIAILVNAGVNLLGPFLIGRTVDMYILTKNYNGVIKFSTILLGLFVVGLVASYLQTIWMGGVSQRILFKLRGTVFNKLQELPVAFFYQNKAGDLISRINNDTDKLNQFFSQSLMQFIGSVFIMLGAGVFLLTINLKLGAATLAPAIILLLCTQLLSPWIKRQNTRSLKSTGDISAEIQESLNNFKVIVAFNRRDYFRKRFEESNEDNYSSAIKAGIANNFFTPIYSLASTFGQLIVIVFGIYLILHGQFTLGLLISFLSYANNFYNPLRQLAALWSNFQTALAGWDRISAILAMENNLIQVAHTVEKSIKEGVLSFKNVHFGYTQGEEVLHNINFTLERGKTYALVGPTGGGKTTTASLMARIFDPTKGTVFLDGVDIRSYSQAERAKKIGFILQEPFLFTGSIKENIIYGNDELRDFSDEQLQVLIKHEGLEEILGLFEQGLQTQVQTGGETISLGQRQLIAFLRAVLRKPELLILDEATANIDTVTEQLLEEILKKLPNETTRVIIAHRLNTIENADEIFFVNGGEIILAGSMEKAVEMLLHNKREN
jgi:ATP-binding cassette subfamily B protein